MIRSLIVLAAITGCSSGTVPEGPSAPAAAPEGASDKPAPPKSEPAKGQSTPVEERAPAPTAPSAQQVLEYDPADPLADLEAADALDGEGEGTVTGAGGCQVLSAPKRVWPRKSAPAITALGDDFVVAGYDTRDASERLFLVRHALGGRTQPLTTWPLSAPHPAPRHAPPAIAARDEQTLTVAATDGEGSLWAGQARVDDKGATLRLLPIAKGADTRFAPAVTHSGSRALVVWTRGTTPMQTHLARLDMAGGVIDTTDLTPASLGAAAATFVHGESPPVLVAVDPRDGMSSILRIQLSEAGDPAPHKVPTAVGMVSSPPRLAAASALFGSRLGYTGMGAAATSAVGLVAIDPPGATPEALVKGTAYGPLHVAALGGSDALLFGADAPTKPGKDPPHQIHLQRVDADGPSQPVVISGPSGDASHVALARSKAGVVGVAFTADQGVYVALLRCGD